MCRRQKRPGPSPSIALALGEPIQDGINTCETPPAPQREPTMAHRRSKLAPGRTPIAKIIRSSSSASPSRCPHTHAALWARLKGLRRGIKTQLYAMGAEVCGHKRSHLRIEGRQHLGRHFHHGHREIPADEMGLCNNFVETANIRTWAMCSMACWVLSVLLSVSF